MPIISRRYVYLAFAFLFTVFLYINFSLPETIATPYRHTSEFTVRINTYRRNLQLRMFLDHYSRCSAINSIQVVWSDPENSPPLSWTKEYDIIINFEIHANNSLNNRFLPKLPISTEAVLSIDDDIIISCDELLKTFDIWTINKRLHAWDPETGEMKYLRWQHTWWNGIYSIMLTKAAFLASSYLEDFRRTVPPAVLTHIDRSRNCEDIAMAHVVAKQAQVAPVWVKVDAKEISDTGISSGGGHFVQRGHCLDVLREHVGKTSWVIGRQKMIPMRALDLWDLRSLWSLWRDDR